MLETTRATKLTCFQWRKYADNDADERLEIFRKHSENGSNLHNSDRKVQIEL